MNLCWFHEDMGEGHAAQDFFEAAQKNLSDSLKYKRKKELFTKDLDRRIDMRLKTEFNFFKSE
jgi:hypothetical protein